MVAKNRLKIALLYWDLFFDPVLGQAATTPMGFGGKDATMIITAEKRVDQHFVPDLGGPIAIDAEVSGVKFVTSLSQIEPAIIAKALGTTEDGNDVVIGGSDPAILPIPYKVVGVTREGLSVTCRMPRGVSTGELNLTSGKGEMVSVPIEIMAEDDETAGMCTITHGASNVEAELSGGVLTRIAGEGFHRMAGEGAAADDLDSITGSSLANNEVLTLGIADVDDPITIIHLADTIELTGEVNWIMDNLRDRLYLKYLSADTEWVEIGRYDAV